MSRYSTWRGMMGGCAAGMLVCLLAVDGAGEVAGGCANPQRRSASAELSTHSSGAHLQLGEAVQLPLEVKPVCRLPAVPLARDAEGAQAPSRGKSKGDR